MSSASDRQSEIYRSRISGRGRLLPVDFEELERLAHRRMSDERFYYFAGGAGSGGTIAANRAAFDRWQILPSALRDVSKRRIDMELFGKRLASPLLLAPVGVLEDAHRDADLAVAEAARDTSVPFILSNQASTPMEICANAMGDSPHWFQLYVSRSDKLVHSFINRAEQSGCSAVVVTIDTTLLGFRTHDLEHAYLPFLYGRGIAQYLSDPVFLDMAEEGLPQAPGAEKASLRALPILFGARRAYKRYAAIDKRSRRSGAAARALRAVSTFTATYSRPSLSWGDVDSIRSMTKLPLLLKGILNPSDASAALEHGIDGIIVSNHGGRQIDGEIASLDALPAVVDAVAGRVPVLFDSGVRTGADMFKALALGARAICIGRPYAFALAAAGRKGVVELIRNLLADFELTMGLAGCASLAAIERAALVPRRELLRQEPRR